MAMIKCPDCKKKISTEAASCPNCGRPLTVEDKKEKKAKYKWWHYLLAGIIVLAILSAVGEKKNKSATSDAAAPTAAQETVPKDPCANIKSMDDWNRASKLFRANNEQCKPKEDTQTYTVISASTLWKAFEQNEVAADQKYKRKRVAVEGRIHKIEKSPMGYPEIIFDVAYGVSIVKCQFPKKYMDAIANMSKGQRVVVIGTVTAFTLGAVLSIDDCDLAESVRK